MPYFPRRIMPLTTKKNSPEADSGSTVRAEDFNLHDEEIRAIEEYLLGTLDGGESTGLRQRIIDVSEKLDKMLLGHRIRAISGHCLSGTKMRFPEAPICYLTKVPAASDREIHVNSTELFPDSGVISILNDIDISSSSEGVTAAEWIRYGSKSGTSFLECERGHGGTTVGSHANRGPLDVNGAPLTPLQLMRGSKRPLPTVLFSLPLFPELGTGTLAELEERISARSSLGPVFPYQSGFQQLRAALGGKDLPDGTAMPAGTNALKTYSDSGLWMDTWELPSETADSIYDMSLFAKLLPYESRSVPGNYSTYTGGGRTWQDLVKYFQSLSPFQLNSGLVSPWDSVIENGYVYSTATILCMKNSFYPVDGDGAYTGGPLQVRYVTTVNSKRSSWWAKFIHPGSPDYTNAKSSGCNVNVWLVGRPRFHLVPIGTPTNGPGGSFYQQAPYYDSNGWITQVGAIPLDITYAIQWLTTMRQNGLVWRADPISLAGSYLKSPDEGRNISPDEAREIINLAWKNGLLKVTVAEQTEANIPVFAGNLNAFCGALSWTTKDGTVKPRVVQMADGTLICYAAEDDNYNDVSQAVVAYMLWSTGI